MTQPNFWIYTVLSPEVSERTVGERLLTALDGP